jgi:hypothetical protein
MTELNTTQEEQATESAQATGMETTEWEVRCAGITYWEITTVMGPNGQPLKDRRGDDVVSTIRRTAGKGKLVALTDYEATRLLAEDAIQKPNSAPIRGFHEDAPTLPTPFTSPVTDDRTGIVNAWNAPIMGNPAPAGPGTPDGSLVDGTAGGSLTPEQIAEAQEAQGRVFTDDEIAEARRILSVAEGGEDPDQDPELSADEQDSFNSYMELDKPDLEAEATARKEADDEFNVTRRDGEDKAPLKEDFAFALAKDDHKGDEG